jgi:hypothetical protein
MKRAFLLVPLLALTACNSIYYAAWEKLGWEKRDLLVSAVKKARGEQKDAGEEFQDAMTQLKKLSGFHGGNLESAYNKFKAEYEDCEAQANKVRSQVRRANLGEGLEKAWRLDKFPKRRSKTNMDPAAVVYSKSTILHRAFEESRLVRAVRAQYLVIALPAAIHLGLGYSTKSRKGGAVPAGQRRTVSEDRKRVV